MVSVVSAGAAVTDGMSLPTTAWRRRSTLPRKAISSSGVAAGTTSSTNQAVPNAFGFTTGMKSPYMTIYFVFRALRTGISGRFCFNSSKVSERWRVA